MEQNKTKTMKVNDKATMKAEKKAKKFAAKEAAKQQKLQKKAEAKAIKLAKKEQARQVKAQKKAQLKLEKIAAKEAAKKAKADEKAWVKAEKYAAKQATEKALEDIKAQVQSQKLATKSLSTTKIEKTKKLDQTTKIYDSIAKVEHDRSSSEKDARLAKLAKENKKITDKYLYLTKEKNCGPKYQSLMILLISIIALLFTIIFVTVYIFYSLDAPNLNQKVAVIIMTLFFALTLLTVSAITGLAISLFVTMKKEQTLTPLSGLFMGIIWILSVFFVVMYMLNLLTGQGILPTTSEVDQLVMTLLLLLVPITDIILGAILYVWVKKQYPEAHIKQKLVEAKEE